MCTHIANFSWRLVFVFGRFVLLLFKGNENEVVTTNWSNKHCGKHWYQFCCLVKLDLLLLIFYSMLMASKKICTVTQDPLIEDIPWAFILLQLLVPTILQYSRVCKLWNRIQLLFNSNLQKLYPPKLSGKTKHCWSFLR